MRKCNCAYNSFVSITVSVCVLTACLCQTSSAFAVDPATTIVVDAAIMVAESGGDDLATVKNIFQDANAPQDGATGDASDPRRQIMSDIGMKRIRILQGDVYCDLDDNGVFGNRPAPDSSGNYPPVVPGDCDLKWQIDWALLSGLSPHVAVAYYMPQSFVQYGPAETWPAAILLPRGLSLNSDSRRLPHGLLRQHRQLARIMDGCRALDGASPECDLAEA
jgi:hypothetical protein